MTTSMRCPRCGGRTYQRQDDAGEYFGCWACGWARWPNPKETHAVSPLLPVWEGQMTALPFSITRALLRRDGKGRYIGLQEDKEEKP